MGKITNIYTNRDGDDITFTLIDEKIISLTGYNTSYVRTVEQNNSPLYKKEHPNREVVPEFVSYVGGPSLWLGMDANDFLFNKKIVHLSEEYLNQDIKRIVTKIDIQGPITYLTYEEKPIKKESKAVEKSSSKKAEY